jgi:short-subunit dehydrogenase
MMAVYYASKAFVLSFSEALAHELAGTGVTVTAVCPGPTLTGFQEAAGLEGRTIPTPVLVSVERVGAVAYRGIMRGKRVVVPGLVNRVLAVGARFGPRRVVTAVVGWVNGGTGSGE